MDSTEKRLPVPPYVAYKTLKNFLDRFKQGVPGRIDRGLMGSMSGAAQSQVTTALKYLGFTSDGGIPTEVMKKYVSGEEETQKEILRKALSDSYPFVFATDAEFDFSTATGSQLREEFEAKTSATGETVGRCIGFLKDAAAEAGIIISPYITQKKARSAAPRKRITYGRKEDLHDSNSGKTIGPSEHTIPPTRTSQADAESSMLLWGLFQRLPKPGSVWSKLDRERWVETLNNVLLLEYREFED